MTKTTLENMEDRQVEVADLRTFIGQIEDDLGGAECCETPEDFDANLDAMVTAAKALIARVEEIRS